MGNRLKALWTVLTARSFGLSTDEGTIYHPANLQEILRERSDLSVQESKQEYLKQSLSKPPRKRKK